MIQSKFLRLFGRKPVFCPTVESQQLIECIRQCPNARAIEGLSAGSKNISQVGCLFHERLSKTVPDKKTRKNIFKKTLQDLQNSNSGVEMIQGKFLRLNETVKL